MSRRQFILVLLIASLGIGMVGCISQDTEDARPELPSTVTRFVDEEAGVVCWMQTRVYSGGIGCLPLSETNLR